MSNPGISFNDSNVKHKTAMPVGKQEFKDTLPLSV